MQFEETLINFIYFVLNNKKYNFNREIFVNDLSLYKNKSVPKNNLIKNGQLNIMIDLSFGPKLHFLLIFSLFVIYVAYSANYDDCSC